jgi:citrate lyase subunit beta / citryl-CoA lyase
VRSLLFVPGDDERKLARAFGCGADCIILDLEDSVAPERKVAARAATRSLLAERRIAGGPQRFVRINPLASGLALADLAAIVGARPDGIVLPKAAGADDVRALDHYLAALESREDIPAGGIAILPIAPETAAAMFTFASYAGASARLCGIMWGCEDLAADVGALANRGPDGAHLEPFRLARSLCLFAAAAAQVGAIDTVFTDFRDEAGLEREARDAALCGFAAKAAIHPGQIAAINAAFTPDADAVAWARRIVAAFDENPGLGAIGIDGKMIDRPHLRAARRLLDRANG